jgi:hypothetical protein
MSNIYFCKKLQYTVYWKTMGHWVYVLKTRAGHSLLFPLFAICSSATSTPLSTIATPLLFRKLQYATRYSLSLLLFHQCCGLHQFEGYVFGKRSTTLTLNHFQTDFNFILNHILMLNLSVEPEPEPLHVTAPAPPN